MKTLFTLSLAFLIGCSNSSSENSPHTDPAINSSLKISAFNIQIFGQSKMSNPSVAVDLVKIISLYDLVLIQEIRDASGSAIVDLLTQVNMVNNNQFEMALGSRVGRSSSKEQYAYFYRKNKVQKMDQREYQDSLDVFEREPLVVRFKELVSKKEFIAIGIHTKPTDAKNEINHLDNVYDYYSNLWGITNGIILGDFNQDCTYLSDNEFLNLDLTIDPRFTHQISKFDDSTIGSTQCAYDQITTTGVISQNIKSSKVFKFEGLNLLSNLLDISDHYPVEITVEL